MIVDFPLPIINYHSHCHTVFPRFFLSRLLKADLDISYDGEIQGEDILTTRASPREVEAELMAKARGV